MTGRLSMADIPGFHEAMNDTADRAASRRAKEKGMTMYDDADRFGLGAISGGQPAQKAAKTMINTDRVAREIDSFVEAEHEQMATASGIMRRIEDLADRVLGAVPTSDGAQNGAKQPMRTGHFGGLLDTHETRDSIYQRMSDALVRIEQVL